MIVAFIRTESAAALPEHAVAQEISSDEVADQADRGRRSARHANPFCAPSSCAVPLATAPRRRRGLGRKPLERRVSRRLAPGREVRGALIGFYYLRSLATRRSQDVEVGSDRHWTR